jgi:hypothetical protein
VIDKWFTQQVQPRLRGPSTLVRFCDDFVMLFAHKADAERVQKVLGKRLGRFGLQLHPDKTRLVDFRPVGSPSAGEEFLGSPPGNRLEALKGDRKGQHIIGINDPRRICFRWTTDGLENFEIVDYH